jgi:hypothetical protein
MVGKRKRRRIANDFSIVPMLGFSTLLNINVLLCTKKFDPKCLIITETQ